MTAKRYYKLGENLRRLLFERNMKPIDLAREVNLPQPTIHRLVTGKSTRPYKSSLEPIADFFSVSVDELLDESPHIEDIWEEKSTSSKTTPLSASQLIKQIPIISWKELDQLAEARKTTQKHVVTMGNLSNETFAVIMPDSSMEPFFARGTLLIFDPHQPPKDRSYVLVNLQENNLYIFRQLLIDGDDRYLKPLNPDLSMFKMRILHNNDRILGSLVESRNQYLPDDQLQLLEDL